MSEIAAIDPGTTQSAFVAWDGDHVRIAVILPNAEVRHLVNRYDGYLFIEQVESYGMAVGREVFETVFWAGRFAEAYRRGVGHGEAAMVPRRTVKLHLCGTMRAKETNIRQALVDRFGPKGTKKAPGTLYGIKSHCWAALALAVTAWDQTITGVEPSIITPVKSAVNVETLTPRQLIALVP